MGESGHCELCGLPLVEVDAYGARLKGCVGCNISTKHKGDPRRISG
jgi:hypothetical protein